MNDSTGLNPAESFIHGAPLKAANWMNDKMNVAPGFHLLFSAIGASVLGGATKVALDVLTGQAKMDDNPLLAPLKPLHGVMRYDPHLHMPDPQDREGFSADQLRHLARNDWVRNLHMFAPAVTGMFGALWGSQHFMKSKGYDFESMDQSLPDNMLGAQRRIQALYSESMGPLSAFLMGTGGGSLRALSGFVMTWFRFLPGAGDYNAVPGLRSFLHGEVSGEFNHVAIKVLDKELVGYLSHAPEELVDWSRVRRATAAIVGQLFGKEAVTDRNLDDLVEGLRRIRADFMESHPEAKVSGLTGVLAKELQGLYTEQVRNHWDEFLMQHSDLSPEKANVAGFGFVPKFVQACAHIFGGSKEIQEQISSYQRHAAELQDRYALQLAHVETQSTPQLPGSSLSEQRQVLPHTPSY